MDNRLSLIGKTFAGDEGPPLLEQMRYFYHEKAATITVPKPLGYSPSIKTIWLSYMKGESLRNGLTEQTSEVLLAQVAQGLATIHQSDFMGLAHVKVTDLLAEFEKKAQKLNRACPSCTNVLTDLNLKVALLAESLPPSSPKVIHGDFHIEQLLVQDDKVIFLDFDGLVWGDPEQDLAEFIVALHFYGYPESAVTAMGQQLRCHYERHVDWAIDPQRLWWYATYEYVNRAYRFYQEQRPEWLSNLTDAVMAIGRVERLINSRETNL